MGRVRAATRVAAFFIVAACSSPLAHACETCERFPLAPENPQLPSVPRNIGRLDVTAAVDTATSFVIEALRGLRLFPRSGVRRGEVEIVQQPLGDRPASDVVADISNGSDVTLLDVDDAEAYIAGDPSPRARMPNFRREHKWALTYRSDAVDAISQPAYSDRFPGMNTTLDDSIVVGLRFELDYGWTR